MYDFSDKVVIVTGASGNLGGAVARAYLAAGARLVLPDRQENRLTTLFTGLNQSSDPKTKDYFVVEHIDLINPSDVDRLISQTLAQFSRIDILAHTAGGYQGGQVPHETSLETWDSMQNLNARMTFLINRAVIPTMIANGSGTIVNVASGSALSAGSRDIAYSASKSEVLRITESMAKAYKGSGISVNAVLPGTIDTPQNREAMPKADFSKWVQPEAIANVILFLTSETGRVINGALIPVNG
jgi:NAD(P)-dependent dehydrogenase (short-subunit alcohol dehydrogenase family)